MDKNKYVKVEYYMNIKEILMEDDIVKSINNNLEELLLLIPEIKYMIGFEHKHPHHHLDVWEHTYTRSKAAFPLEWLHEAKFWVNVARVDNAFGDRNLVAVRED